MLRLSSAEALLGNSEQVQQNYFYFSLLHLIIISESFTLSAARYGTSVSCITSDLNSMLFFYQHARAT